MEAVLIIAVIVVVVLALVVVGGRLQKKRIAELTAFATGRGWRYVQRDDSLAGRFVGHPFGEGFNRQAHHVISGQHRGHGFVGFEYVHHERHGSGKNRHTVTYRNQVLGLATPAPRPTLQLSREGLGRKLLGLVGVRDLQLESEEFNKAFLIKAEDDRFAYDVLHPRMMEWMLADARCQRWPFRYERADLLTWEQGRLDEQRLLAMLDYLCDVQEHSPDYLWKS